MTTLSSFIQQVKSTGLAKSSKYLVTFIKPAVVTSSFSTTKVEKLCLFCDQIQIPGISIASTPNRSYGELREAPYEKMFEPVNLSFYVDSNLDIKNFFDSWVNGMQDPVTRQWAFYRDYIADINIAVYNEENNQVYSITLYEAYPKNVSAIQLDYAAKDVMKLQVTLNYKYWWTSKTQQVNTAGYDAFQEFQDFDFNSLIQQGGLASLMQTGFTIPSNYFNDYNDFVTTFQDRYGEVKEEVAAVSSLMSRFG